MSTNQKSRRGGILLQGSILAGASILVRIIGAVYRIPLTNIIGDRGNDYYSGAFEVYAMLLLISSYSLPMAVSKLVSSHLTLGERRNAYKIFKGSLLFAFVTGSIAMIITALGADYFSTSLVKTPLSYYALLALVPTLLISAILGVFRGYFQGMGTMVPTAISQVLEQILNAVVSIVAAVLLCRIGEKVGAVLGDKVSFSASFGAAGGTIGTGVGALTGLVFMFLVYLIYRPIQKKRIKKSLHEPSMSYGDIIKLLILTVTPVILSTTIYNSSTLIDMSIFKNLMHFQGISADKVSETWGIYSGKYRVLVNVPIAIASAMAASTVPGLSGAMAKKEFNEVRRKIRMATRFTMLISIPCAVGLAVLAKPVLDLLYPNSNPSVTTIRLLQLGGIIIFFTSLSTLSNGILQGINRMKDPVKHALISLLVHVIVLVIFLQVFKMGVYGVLWSNVVFVAMMCLLNSISIKRYAKYRQEVRKTFFIPIFSSGIMGIVVYLIHKVIYIYTQKEIFPVGISIIVGVIIYGICMLLFKGLNENELKQLPKGNLIIGIAKKLRLL